MKPSSLANHANSCDAYLRPLSVTSGSGIPSLAKIYLYIGVESRLTMSFLPTWLYSLHVRNVYEHVHANILPLSLIRDRYDHRLGWIESLYGACRAARRQLLRMLAESVPSDGRLSPRCERHLVPP